MKITPEQIENQIKDIAYHSFYETTTICAIKLQCGFVAVGKSDCIDVAEYDLETGKVFAYKDAISKLYEFESYKFLQNNPRN